MQTLPDSTLGANIVSFAFLVTTGATVRTQFQIFPHRMNGALVQTSVTDIGFYIMIIVVVIYGSVLLKSRFLVLPFHVASLKL
jgi:hypothetical protein